MTTIPPRQGIAWRFHRTAAVPLFLSVVLAAHPTANAAATESGQLEQCRAGWASFDESVKSLRVEYTLRIDALADPAALKQYLNITEAKGSEAKQVFAFKGDLRYFAYDNAEYFESGKLKKAGENYEYAYNGERRQMHSQGTNWIGFDSAHGRAGNDGGYFSQFYLRALFHALPDVFNSDSRATLRLPDALGDDDVHVRPAPEEVDGSSCVVVELRKNHRMLWADPKLNYALRQWEVRTTDTNRLVWRYHLRDYKPVAPGVQLPFLIVQDRGAPQAPEEFQNSPLMRWTMRVTHVGVNNVPDSMFTLELKPGMMVTDRTAWLGPVMYTVPANVKDIDSAKSSAVARAVDFFGGHAGSSSAWRRWMLLGALNLVFCGALAAAYFVRRRRKVLVLLLALSAWPTTAHAAEDSTIEACRSAWKNANDRLSNLKVEYEITTEGLVPPAALKKYMGVIRLVRENHTFAFKGEQRYFNFEKASPEVTDFAPEVESSQDAAKTAPSKLAGLSPVSAKRDQKSRARRTTKHSEYAFNGHTRQIRSHDNDSLNRVPRSQISTNDAASFDQTYLHAQLRTLPDVFDQSDSRSEWRLPDALAGEEVHVRNSPETIDGKSCIVIELRKRNIVLWCDPACGYALRQWEGRTPTTNVLCNRYHLQDYREVVPSLWFPFAVVQEAGNPQAPDEYRNVPLMTYTIRVTHLEVNDVADAQFTLEAPAGTRISDRTIGGQERPIMYTVPANAAQLDATISRALSRQTGKADAQLGRWMLLVELNVLLAALLVVVYFRRRAKSRAT
jgi:hypothetical protein